MCLVQVIFFVGVQLNITASSTPKAVADARQLQVAAAHHVASREPADAAPPKVSLGHGSHQRDAVLLPAATQQVQSQVGAAYVSCRQTIVPAAPACCQQTCIL